MKRLIFRAEVPVNGTYQIKFGILDDETCNIQLLNYVELMHSDMEIVNLRWENTVAKMVDCERGLPYITMTKYNQDEVYYALQMQDTRLIKLVSNTGKVCIMSWNVLADWMSVGNKYVSNLLSKAGYAINTAVTHTTPLNRELNKVITV